MRAGLALVILTSLGAGGCSSAATADRDRERSVEVQVEVVDGRDPGGIELTATKREPGPPYTVFVVQVTDEIGYSQPTCDDALAGGAQMAEQLGVPVPTACTSDERVDQVVTDEVLAVADSEGIARFALLQGTYRVSGSVEIVPGDDGCEWAGTTMIDADVTEGPLSLRLDGNTCE